MSFDASAVFGEPVLAATTVSPRDFRQTPAFASTAYLTVTENEVALIKVEPIGERIRLGNVLARVPRSEVVSAEVSDGILNNPVTIAFSDGGRWEFEVSRLIKKRAQRVVEVLDS